MSSELLNADHELTVSFLKNIRSNMKFVVFDALPELVRPQRRPKEGASSFLLKKFVKSTQSIWTEIDSLFKRAYKLVRLMPAESLRLAGLAEKYLRDRLSWLRRLSRELHRNLKDISKNPLFRRILRAIFRIANSFLGSLARVLIIAEPIKEFKDYVESGLDVIL